MERFTMSTTDQRRDFDQKTLGFVLAEVPCPAVVFLKQLDLPHRVFLCQLPLHRFVEKMVQQRFSADRGSSEFRLFSSRRSAGHELSHKKLPKRPTFTRPVRVKGCGCSRPLRTRNTP